MVHSPVTCPAPSSLPSYLKACHTTPPPPPPRPFLFLCMVLEFCSFCFTDGLFLKTLPSSPRAPPVAISRPTWDLGFWPHEAACGLSALRPGLGPRRPRREQGVLTAAPPGKPRFLFFVFFKSHVFKVAVRLLSFTHVLN